jgi:hypothetical protein
MKAKKRYEAPRLEKVESKYTKDGFLKCRVCGCSEFEPCEPPCSWVPHTDICDSCHEVATTIRLWMVGAHRPSVAALLREVRLRREADHETARKLWAGKVKRATA